MREGGGATRRRCWRRLFSLRIISIVRVSFFPVVSRRSYIAIRTCETGIFVRKEEKVFVSRVVRIEMPRNLLLRFYYYIFRL